MDTHHAIFHEGQWIDIPSIEQLCQHLKAKFFEQERTLQRLQQENDQLKSNIWEKEEVACLKQRYEQMHEDYLRGFPITKDQQTKIATWRAEHNCRYRNKKIGGYCHYTFTPTPIGVAGEIVCSCGKKFTFQEIE